MPIDASTLPLSPNFILTAAAVAGAVAFIVVPEVTHREIARSGWAAICEADIHADLEATRAPRQFIPEGTDCRSTFGKFYRELGALCDVIGNVDPAAPARDAERRLREAEDARIRRAAAKTGSRCECAETLYIEEERLSLAVYVASGRSHTSGCSEQAGRAPPRSRFTRL